MDLDRIKLIAQKYKSTEYNNETQECRDLYNQLLSTSESISLLIPMFNEANDQGNKTELMILEILFHRIAYFWHELEQEAQEEAFNFFFYEIPAEKIQRYIDPLLQSTSNFGLSRIEGNIMHLISKTQAIIGTYCFPSPFDELWNVASAFHDVHFALFVSYFYSAAANPSFDNLENFQQIRVATNAEADSLIFEKITSIIQNPQEIDFGILALSKYIKWGSSFADWFNDGDYFQCIIDQCTVDQSNKSSCVEIICNTIIRLNYFCEEWVQNIPFDAIFNNSKQIVDNFSRNPNINYPINIDFVRKAASLLNTFIMTLDHSFDLVSEMFQYLFFFASISDIDTTSRIIPSLTYFVQNTKDEQVVDSIVRRLDGYFQNEKKNCFMEADQFPKTLCNLLVKADPEIVGPYIYNACETQEFATSPSYAAAIIASLSYMNDIPIDAKLEIFSKFYPLDQSLDPEKNMQQFFLNYYLVFYLSKFYVPTPQEVARMVPQEQQALINESCTQAINQINESLVNCILQQGDVIFNPELEYQFLKPIRQIISKLRKFHIDFNEELINFLIDSLTQLSPLPDEGAKIIGYLINNDSIMEIIPQLLQSFVETLEQERNDQLVSFSLTLITSLKYAEINEQLAEFLFQHLDNIHSYIISGSQYDQLIGLLLKAYAKIAKFNPDMPQYFGQLIDQENDLITQNTKFAIGCSFHLMDEIMKSEYEYDPEFLSFFFDYVPKLYYYSVLILPPSFEDDQILKEISIYYSNFLKTFMSANKGEDEQSLVNLLQTIAETICTQLDTGYKHSHFVTAMIDLFIYLIDQGFPASEICNIFLVHSMSFMLNPGFNPAFETHKLLMETSIRFHALLIHNAPNEFRAKFTEFLEIIGVTDRTGAFFEGYIETCQSPEAQNIEMLFSNPDFYMFYNSMISDKEANAWEPPQQSATSSQI